MSHHTQLYYTFETDTMDCPRPLGKMIWTSVRHTAVQFRIRPLNTSLQFSEPLWVESPGSPKAVKPILKWSWRKTEKGRGRLGSGMCLQHQLRVLGTADGNPHGLLHFLSRSYHMRQECHTHDTGQLCIITEPDPIHLCLHYLCVWLSYSVPGTEGNVTCD